MPHGAGNVGNTAERCRARAKPAAFDGKRTLFVRHTRIKQMKGLSGDPHTRRVTKVWPPPPKRLASLSASGSPPPTKHPFQHHTHTPPSSAMATTQEPLSALPCTGERLQHIISRQVAEPDADDAAELGRLLASAKTRANQAFLASMLLPTSAAQQRASPGTDGSAEALGEDDIDELRGFVLSAKSDASAARVARSLATELLHPPQTADGAADAAEVLALLGAARRPRVRGLLRLTAARLAADGARARGSPGGAPSPRMPPPSRPRSQPPPALPPLASRPAARASGHRGRRARRGGGAQRERRRRTAPRPVGRPRRRRLPMADPHSLLQRDRVATGTAPQQRRERGSGRGGGADAAAADAASLAGESGGVVALYDRGARVAAGRASSPRGRARRSRPPPRDPT